MNFVLNVAFQFYLVFKGNPFSYYYQILTSVVICAVCLGALPIVASYVSGLTGFVLSCILIALQGFANAIFQSNMYGICGYLPIKFIIAISYGNGIAGIGVNVIKFILLGAFESKDDNIDNLIYQTFIFYIIAVVMLIIGFILLLIVFKDPWFINEISKNGSTEFSKETIDKVRQEFFISEELVNNDSKIVLDNKAVNNIEGNNDIIKEEEEPKTNFQTLKILLKQLHKLNINVFYIFFVTFSVFPGLLFTLEML